MTRWKVREIRDLIDRLPGLDTGAVRRGDSHTTYSITVHVAGCSDTLRVHGVSLRGALANPDDVDVESIEVATAVSGNDTSNGSALSEAHARVKGALMRRGHHVVGNVDTCV